MSGKVRHGGGWFVSIVDARSLSGKHSQGRGDIKYKKINRRFFQGGQTMMAIYARSCSGLILVQKYKWQKDNTWKEENNIRINISFRLKTDLAILFTGKYEVKAHSFIE